MLASHASGHLAVFLSEVAGQTRILAPLDPAGSSTATFTVATAVPVALKNADT